MTNRNGVLVRSSIPIRNGTVTTIHFTNRNAVPVRSGPFRALSRPSTKNPDKSPLYKFYPNCSRGLLSRGLLSGGFCPGWFLSIPSVRIHLLQQKVKNHFKFHVSYV